MKQMTKQELQAEVLKLKERISSLEKGIQAEPQDRWKPTSGEGYYFISSDSIGLDTWTGHSIDEGKYRVGNVFKTREEAELQALRLEAMANRILVGEGEQYWYWSFKSRSATYFQTDGDNIDLQFFIVGNMHRTEAEALAWGEKYHKAFRVLWDRSLVESE